MTDRPIPFANSYAGLPDRFFARVHPTPVRAPRLLRANAALAEDLGIDPAWLSGPEGVATVAGNHLPAGADPIAMAYAGHQFGHFVPQLGDGRAVLLGEVIDRAGVRRDIHLKGSGPTPFSRRGDGRAAVGPVLREFVIGEAMAAFGIPTTRILSAVATGERVYREEPLPGAVLARVGASHVRVGTFQYFAARSDVEALRILADYVIARHYPAAASAANPTLALLEHVIAAQADLVAAWMHVGFIHGVMNTDNMSVAGETIDYGPCAFIDAYHPSMVFSSIDQQGRYAYANQPRAASWNLARFAETLLPLISADEADAVAGAERALAAFGPRFEAALIAGFRRKIGLTTEEEGDTPLVRDLLTAMAETGADFTLVFRRLAAAAEQPEADAGVAAQFSDPGAYAAWAVRWRERLAREPSVAPCARSAAMRAVNPAYIPRNHRVEAVIRAAVEDDDLGPLDELLAVLSRSYDDQPGREAYAEPPQPHERVLQTFCGT